MPPSPAGAAGVLALQRVVGNQAVARMLGTQRPEGLRAEGEEEPAVQRHEASPAGAGAAAAPAPANRTGLPDGLKRGVEALSGMSMDDVRVHYDSSAPARVDALAYARGTEIHVAPGQERHLPHEAWHVVQQKQGRVAATLEVAGTPVNDDPGLEREADAMGMRAASVTSPTPPAPPRTEGGSVHVSTEPAREQESTAVEPGSGSPGRHPPIQAMLVKVATKRQPGSDERVISNVDFEGRVPTTATKGQGDHTVAETLAEQALIRTCVGLTHAQAAGALREALPHLHDQTVALVGTARTALGFPEVVELLEVYTQLANHPAVEGEDRNTALEAFLEAFLRLWNKFPGSAYPRSAGFTSGGGGGAGEKEAIHGVRELDRAISHRTEGRAEEQDIPPLAANAAMLIDFVPRELRQPVEDPDVKHILSVLPQIEHDFDDLYDAAVEATEDYADEFGLDEWQEDAVFQRLEGLEGVVTHVSRAVELVLDAVPEMKVFYAELAEAVALKYAHRHGLDDLDTRLLASAVNERVSPYTPADYR